MLAKKQIPKNASLFNVYNKSNPTLVSWCEFRVGVKRWRPWKVHRCDIQSSADQFPRIPYPLVTSCEAEELSQNFGFCLDINKLCLYFCSWKRRLRSLYKVWQRWKVISQKRGNHQFHVTSTVHRAGTPEPHDYICKLCTAQGGPRLATIWLADGVVVQYCAPSPHLGAFPMVWLW